MPLIDEEAFKAELVARAVEDPAFRAALKADPKGTVERALGHPLPDGLVITVLQESLQSVYLVLPLAVAEREVAASSSQSLDDEALDQIAGGLAQPTLDYRHDGALNRALRRRLDRDEP